jgi:UDP-glucose 4-epimerase
MEILVTGATGFIGTHLVARLAKQHTVFALVRGPDRVPSAPTIHPIHADLLVPLNEHLLPKTIDVIVHLAQHNGSFPAEAHELYSVNTARTQDLLSYAVRSSAGQCVLASSGDVYGYRVDACREADPVNPKSFYAVTKHSSELLLQAYEGYLIPTVLRLFTPYGPGQVGRLIASLAERIRKEIPVRVHMGDRPMLTPTYIDDVAEAFERAIETRTSGIFNVAGNETVSVRGLAETIGRLLGKDPVFEETGEDVSNLIGDNTYLRQRLGLSALTALREGLERTFA